MRAPAQLRRLAALTDEAVDRPGVHELARPLAEVRHLGVALGDVDRLDAEALRQRGPALARGGRQARLADVARDGQQRLLDEMRDQTWIGAMRQHRGRPARQRAGQLEHGFAQRVVGALRGGERRIGVAAGPGFDAGVEIQRAELLAQRDQRHRGHVDRQVQQEVAAAQQRRQHVAIVAAGQRLDAHGNAIRRGDRRPTRIAGDDADLRGRDVDVAQDERQDALADAAEAQHHQAGGEGDVLHRSSSLRNKMAVRRRRRARPCPPSWAAARRAPRRYGHDRSR